MSQPIVCLNNVAKSFKGLKVLKDISFDVQSGQLVTLLGINGAGKTTTINLILGIEKPDCGDITVFGHQPGSIDVLQSIGVTPQSTGFPEGITAAEVIHFVSQHFPNPIKLDDIATQFGLTELLTRPTNSLSGGQKRRLAVALAFLGRPKCVFLDEPTTGLDVKSRQQIWAAIRQYLAQGGTIFLTTHYLEEAERLSTRVIILEQGVIKMAGSVNEIKALAGLARVRFYAPSLPESLPYIEKIEEHGGYYTLHSHNTDGLIHELVTQGVKFSQLQIIESSLESAYLKMTDSEQGL